jgi:Domain of unknown function (DUF4145)
MDGYQFFASIFQSLVSLAWPAAFVIAVMLFRERLRSLLPLLRVKHKDFEASFRLEQAEKEAALLPPTVPRLEAQPTPEEKSKFEQIAELSPRAAILETRSDVEEAVRSYADAVGYEARKTLTFLPLVRLLRSKGYLDPTSSALLDDLRVIGNNAAHGTDQVFTKEDALRYRSLADQVINQLSQRSPPK